MRIRKSTNALAIQACLQIELYTHAVDGLSENDFILAAKIDAATSDD